LIIKSQPPQFLATVGYVSSPPMHSVAEDAISFSSAYKSTPEGESAAKKPHENEENRRYIFGGFQHYHHKTMDSAWLCLPLCVAFALR
jgi:hypothetical protein